MVVHPWKLKLSQVYSGLLCSNASNHQFRYQFSILLPGSNGIPEWVSHQRMGCEVSIELPMNWYEDDNFLGFVLFFHHVPLDDDECETTEGSIPHCELTISHGDQSERLEEISFYFKCKTYLASHLLSGKHCYDSDSTPDPAIWVTYFPQIDIPSEYRSRRRNNFKDHFHTPIGVGSFKCGDNACFKLYLNPSKKSNQKN
ncbi:unnamed protein product, partial [Vitis vinifera]